jgi:hypothetical protein
MLVSNIYDANYCIFTGYAIDSIYMGIKFRLFGSFWRNIGLLRACLEACGSMEAFFVPAGGFAGAF